MSLGVQQIDGSKEHSYGAEKFEGRQVGSSGLGSKARTSLDKFSRVYRFRREREVEEYYVHEEQYVWKPVSLCDGEESERQVQHPHPRAI
jgi:hypothetical protein